MSAAGSRSRPEGEKRFSVRQIGLAVGIVSLALLAMLGCGLANPTASGESNSRSLGHLRFSDWSPPVPLQGTGINTASREQNPFMTPDELTLYFTSNRAEPGDDPTVPADLDLNIYVSKRHSRKDAWGTPTLVTSLNSSANDLGAKITIDGLRVFFWSNRSGNNEIYMATRTNPRDDDGWSNLFPLGAGVNTSKDENAPQYLFGKLYFGRGDQMTGQSDLYVATVNRKGEVLGEAVPLTELNQPSNPIPAPGDTTNDASPTIRIDGREIFFWRGSTTVTDIWTSTRKSIFDTWDPPKLVTELNSTSGDTTSFLSFDARTIILDSSRPGGGGGGRDLWISTRTIDFVPRFDAEAD